VLVAASEASIVQAGESGAPQQYRGVGAVMDGGGALLSERSERHVDRER
jgi:hypothetical protein